MDIPETIRTSETRIAVSREKHLIAKETFATEKTPQVALRVKNHLHRRLITREGNRKDGKKTGGNLQVSSPVKEQADNQSRVLGTAPT
jgi:hypothetical protein